MATRERNYTKFGISLQGVAMLIFRFLKIWTFVHEHHSYMKIYRIAYRTGGMKFF